MKLQQLLRALEYCADASLDLDSLCSAVVFAYLRTYSSLSSSNTIHTPLSNLPRADLSLRPELRPVLSLAQFKPNDLITLSDLPPPDQCASTLNPQRTTWILVDHNALQGELGALYGGRVSGVIDHHDDENKVPKDCGEEPRIINKSGSCTSLVVQHCKEAWDALSKKSRTDEIAAWDAELAHLALAPILIDTTNLTSASKTTPADTQAVEYLEAKIRASEDHDGCYNRDEYFRQISEAKTDIGGLSLNDILRKDYKQWTESGSVNLGISSVVKDLQFLLEKAGGEGVFYESIKKFAAKRKLSIYAVMTTSTTDGKFKRELLVCALDESGARAAKAFEREAATTLGLRPCEDGKLDVESWGAGAEGGWMRSWVQEKIENSRKQVGPLLRKAMNS